MAILTTACSNQTGPSASVWRAAAGALALAVGLGVAGFAATGAALAEPAHHGWRVHPRDFNATVGPGFAAPGAAMGSWRYDVFRRGGCDSAYPMHESSPCGSATGGPVGGMGS